MNLWRYDCSVFKDIKGDKKLNLHHMDFEVTNFSNWENTSPARFYWEEKKKKPKTFLE